MTKLILTLLFGLLLTACGMGSNEVSQGGANGETPEASEEVGISLREASPQKFVYEVKNLTEEKLTFDFTSSQRYDYAVKTKDGEQIYLFSSVALFLQVVGQEEILPGESLNYEIDVTELSLASGEYTLSAWLTPEEGPSFTISKEFTVSE